MKKKQNAPFEQMFKTMYPELVRRACQLMGDMDEAKDTVGEVMQTAYRAYTHHLALLLLGA